MSTERPNPRDIDTRTEAIDEPTGSIEFGPRRAAFPDLERSGEDDKPGSSSNLGGPENAAVRKAQARRPGRKAGFWRGVWRRLSGQAA